MDLGIEGKTAVILGGSHGIGFACSRRLAREGCKIFLVSRDAGNVARAVQAIKDAGGAIGSQALGFMTGYTGEQRTYAIQFIKGFGQF
jgi:NAD(P)-dependent dehydrogenase (short-subunit alcohol dehydrogenase family)